ncbi:unnamed protein product [Tenebrio molitor]|nr:unnamed protein product [Tenebrio molitor]
MYFSSLQDLNVLIFWFKEYHNSDEKFRIKNVSKDVKNVSVRNVMFMDMYATHEVLHIDKLCGLY